MDNHLVNDNPESDDRHHVGENDKMRPGLDTVGDPEDRTSESLHLGRAGYSFNGVSNYDPIRLRDGANERQRDAQEAQSRA